MTTENYISIEITRRGVTPCIDVMQEDKYCRDLVISLTWEGFLLTLDAGTTAVIMYSKPDGTGGTYDKLPDGQAAYAFELNGSNIRVKLAPQVCTVPGLVKLSVALNSGSSVLHTFVIHIKVHPTPGINVKSEDYNNGGSTGNGATQEQLEQIQQNTEAIERLSEQMNALQREVVGISVTEDADGTVTMVNTFEGGATETIVITPDGAGNPASLTYNGTAIPIIWTEAAE